MDQLEQRFHKVMGSMLGNESLAASLNDDAAGELLSWGEQAAKEIVNGTNNMDDATAEEHMAPRLRALRLMLRAVGRWVGEADTLNEEDRLALWKRIGEQAQLLFGDTFVLPSMDEAVANIPQGASLQQVVEWLKKYMDEIRAKGQDHAA